MPNRDSNPTFKFTKAQAQLLIPRGHWMGDRCTTSADSVSRDFHTFETKLAHCSHILTFYYILIPFNVNVYTIFPSSSPTYNIDFCHCNYFTHII
jgi:hypothetical protein